MRSQAIGLVMTLIATTAFVEKTLLEAPKAIGPYCQAIQSGKLLRGATVEINVIAAKS